jgi:LemA protein
VIILFLGVIVVVQYNRLVLLKNTIDQAFADIDVQLKNRFDLIENLVNTVKGYASHEKQTLTQLAEARTAFLNAGNNMSLKAKADNELSSALKSLFAVSENYPDLKANTNFLELQRELSNLENKLAAARRFSNSTIKEYDVALQSFPTNLIANIFGFKKQKNYFAVTTEAEKKVPTVKFE